MNANKNYSWMEIKHFIPFRSRMIYWDKTSFLGDVEFEKRNIHIAFKEYFFKEDSPFIAIIITFWTKDKEKVEEALTALDTRLKIIDKDYEDWLTKWRSGIDTQLKKG